jgi:hypothetical protein
MRQQTLTGCAFCDAPPDTETGDAHTWGQDEPITHPICVDCAIQTEPNPDERDHVACDGCGLVIEMAAALTRDLTVFGHLEGPLQYCPRCGPGGAATYRTRDPEAQRVPDDRSTGRGSRCTHENS